MHPLNAPRQHRFQSRPSAAGEVDGELLRDLFGHSLVDVEFVAGLPGRDRVVARSGDTTGQAMDRINGAGRGLTAAQFGSRRSFSLT
jgi:hypothetical protein